jgi:hypothetical protein
MKKDLNKVPMGSSRTQNPSKNSSRVFPKKTSLNDIAIEDKTHKRTNFQNKEVREPPKSPRPEKNPNKPGTLFNTRRRIQPN